MTFPIALLGLGALVSFAIRKRIKIAAPFTIAVLLAANTFLVSIDVGNTTEILGLQLRLSPLAQLGGAVLLGSVTLLVLSVWVDEPAYNFFPTALAAAAAVLAVLTLTSPIAIYAALGVCLVPTALDPERHVMLIDFTILSSLLHGAAMTYDSFAQEHEMRHLVGDVPILFLLAAVLIWLHPRWPREDHTKATSGASADRAA